MLLNLILRLSSLGRTDGITRCLLDRNDHAQLSHAAEFKKAPDDPSAQHLPDRHMDSHAFRETYYLKTELAAFCRDNNLSTAGSKEELTERIAFFLDTGKKMKTPARPVTHRKQLDEISGQSIIEEGFVCTETHRAFFLKAIGPSFSFIVPFQKWLKENAGKTYDEAVAAYHEIRKEKADSRHSGRHPIGKQFEYNTYIRDFFADNAGKTLDDAIRCWKYKRNLKGHNRYERSDLTALSEK